MAKESSVARNNKRIKMVEKYSTKRMELRLKSKKIIKIS